jgi:hypothetical protein
VPLACERGGTDERIQAVTIAMFRALDALATDTPHHEHECGAHDDACDDECCIAAAVIPAEGLE